MEKHIYIDCTLIKNHPDCNAYMDYLVGNNFVHNVENLPYGILPFSLRDDFIDFIFNNLCVQKIAVPDEDDNWTDMAVLINMDCTRIELLINADGSKSAATESRIARKALERYLNQLSLSKNDYNVVFHLGEILCDAYQYNGEEYTLPSGLHYVVVGKPFHGDIINNILNNISIRRHDGKIEQVIMEALGITHEQAKFEHAFCYGNTCRYSTYFDYREKHLILFLTADENGGQTIEVSTLKAESSVKVNDIHDLKSVIDQKFFNDAPMEAPKEEPVESPKEKPEVEPEEVLKVGADILVSVKVNAYIDAFTTKRAEVISRTANGEDWLAEFNEIASPIEVVGYYFYTYGITKALKWWKKNSEKSERTEFDEDVDKIFDSIFCPFCKQKKRMSFGSIEVSLQYQEDGKVRCYHKDEYTGTMDFPNCPQCGSKLE